jgi:hypothetical protein
VRRNPKEIVIHFAGKHGEMIRKNYQQMNYAADGKKDLPLFPDVTDQSESFR